MMNMNAAPFGTVLKGNTYAGRGLVIGQTPDGKNAVAAYFIMGRSVNSRNRVFAEKDGALFTEPFDSSKVEDPTLIIYAAMRQFENQLIVTNGDQTDTIYESLQKGGSFKEALDTRCFEPDAPNFTPRISGLLTFSDSGFGYEMSLLKSADDSGTGCNRFLFDYSPVAGLGHFLHTYRCNGDPLPSFEGEPEKVLIPNGIDMFTSSLWDALDADNRISLYVRYISLADGKEQNRMINKNQRSVDA